MEECVREAGRRQRVCQHGGALMHDLAAQQLIEPAAVGAFGRQRPGRRETLGQRGLGFFRQQQATQAAVGIGECGGDRVMAIEPECAARGLGRARAGPIAMRRRAAMVTRAVMMWTRLVRTLGLLIAVVRLMALPIRWSRADVTLGAIRVRGTLAGWAAEAGSGFSTCVVPRAARRLVLVARRAAEIAARAAVRRRWRLLRRRLRLRWLTGA